MAITKEFVQRVRKNIGEHPDLDLGSLARSLGAREADVITALPVAMRLKARNTAFEAIWHRMAYWGSLGAVLIGKHRQPVPLREGTSLKLLMQGKLKVSDSKGVFSFINMREALGYIWFIEQPADPSRAYSISFHDKNGAHLLSVILGTDESGALLPGQMADYEDMKKSYGVIPMPKNRCKGCKSCHCEAANGAC